MNNSYKNRSRNNFIKNQSNTKNSSNIKTTHKMDILKIVLILVLVILTIIVLYIIIFAIKYISTNCYDKMTFWDYLTGFTLSDVCRSKYKPASFKERTYDNEKEVYHISNQDFTFDQAKCKCEAYDGRLAKKEELIKAYNKGANWCNYGWGEGQDAYFPVQKCIWNEKQAHHKTKNTCGLKAGINGGHFASPLLKFGANCYGIKPRGSLAIEKKAYCPSKNICKLTKNKHSSKKLGSDIIAPYNHDQWSQYIK